MKEFKGTKGKWLRDDSAIVVNNIQIADVYCSSECSVAEMNAEDCNEMRANAQLIATAPELLEALIDLVKIVEAYDDESYSTAYARDIIDTALTIE